MRIAVFGSKPYDRQYLSAANADLGHELVFHEARLLLETASLARGFPAVCVFVNDRIDDAVVDALISGGTRVVALRCAGFNNIDLASAERRGLAVVRVPAYSPHAVAEHALALILTLNRHTHRAYARVREGNFALDGLIGFDLYGKTVGVVGTGRIGTAAVAIFRGLGCKVLATDPAPNQECERLGAAYVTFQELLAASDVVTMHCPLSPSTVHLVDGPALGRMKRGAMLINTSRGALIDARAAIAALKSGQLGSLGLDVYEEEADLFFEDLSNRVLQDDVFARLLTFPNVVVTAHQAFFTHEALTGIAETTLNNVSAFERGEPLVNEVRWRDVRATVQR